MADEEREEEIKEIVQKVLKEQGGEISDEEAKMQRCVVDCSNCFHACAQTLSYCLSMGNKFVDPTFFKKFQDCAEISHLTASFMLRESPYSKVVAKTCHDLTQECIAVCDEFTLDAQMRACKKYLEACRDSCQLFTTD